MKKIQFTVHGVPVGKGRPKFFRRQLSHDRSFVGVYTPTKTKMAENDLKSQALASKPKTLITGPVYLSVDIYRPIPKSFSKKKLQMAAERILRPITKPDWDNYGKLTSDALNGLYWKDDSQVVEARVRKFYSDAPRQEITVEYEDMATAAEGGE